MIISHEDIAAVVAFMVVRELAETAEERCGPEQAIVDWTLARPDHDADLVALGAFVDVLSWQAASHIENLWRAA